MTPDGGVHQTIRLSRTGREPLEFDGTLVAEASTHAHRGPQENRWHDLSVYRTRGGKIVLAVRYNTCWQGEHDHHDAEVFDAPSDLADYLQAYPALRAVAGYPPGVKDYEDKQRRLKHALQAAFERAVSRLLDDVPGAVERID